MKTSLPRALTLPSGLRVTLGAARPAAPAPRPGRGEPLFADAVRLLSRGDVTLGGARVEDLTLADFHVLRAVLSKCGYLDEPAVHLACENCGADLEIRPCATLEIGPYVDAELGDPELDRTLAPEGPHEIAAVTEGREVSEIVFSQRTVGEAEPLFQALARERFDVTPAVVRGLGVVSIDGERDAARLADLLAACEDDAWRDLEDVFLAVHYPARLVAAVFCASCRARNDVEAPSEREFSLEDDEASDPARAEEPPFPTFEAFAERAQAIASSLLEDVRGPDVEVLVSDEVADVDEGGEPLLGSYVPPYEGDATTPFRPPTVTIYYRTFGSLARLDGPYDWDAELHETIEHELEHHENWLRGDDPLDHAERAEIDAEARRVVGKRELTRRVLDGFGASLLDFIRRTWPLWLLAMLALALTLFGVDSSD